jgi:hypothetical protein
MRVSSGMESTVGTARGPGVDPRPDLHRPGEFHPGGKEEIMITFVIAISAVIRRITVSLTLRLKRK